MFARVPRGLLALALGVGAIAPTGCYYLSGQYQVDQENAALAAWVGRTSIELLKERGAPHTILDDTKGGKIWVYEDVTTSTSPSRSETTYDPRSHTETTTTYPGYTTTSTLQELFWIDAGGRIYNATWHRK